MSYNTHRIMKFLDPNNKNDAISFVIDDLGDGKYHKYMEMVIGIDEQCVWYMLCLFGPNRC